MQYILKKTARRNTWVGETLPINKAMDKEKSLLLRKLLEKADLMEDSNLAIYEWKPLILGRLNTRKNEEYLQKK